MYLQNAWQEFNQNLKSGVSSVHYINEVIKSFSAGMTFRPSDPYVETLNEKMSRLFETGLVQGIVRMNSNNKKSILEEPGPEVLTMEHIGTGFLFCMCFAAIAFLVFIFELLFKAVKAFILNSVYSYIGLLSLKEYYKVRSCELI